MSKEVTQSLMDQLLANGIGSLAGTNKVKEAPAAIEVAPGIFTRTNYRMPKALINGEIDIASIECLSNTPWGGTPSSKFFSSDFGEGFTAGIEGFIAGARHYAAENCIDFHEMMLGKSFISRTGGSRNKLIALSFIGRGQSPDKPGFVTIDGKRRVLSQFHRDAFRKSMLNLFSQVLTSESTEQIRKEAEAEGRAIRIGLPRMLGGSGGIYFNALLKELTNIKPEGIELYLFIPEQPNRAVAVGIHVNKKDGRNAQGKRKVQGEKHNAGGRKGEDRGKKSWPARNDGNAVRDNGQDVAAEPVAE